LHEESGRREQDLGITFRAIVPQQMIGDTELGRAGAEGYAERNRRAS